MARVGAPRMLLHPEDASDLGLTEGSQARLSNSIGALTLAVELCADVPRLCVRIDGFIDAARTPEKIGVNVLTPPDVSDIGDGAVTYSTRVTVTPVA